MYNIIDYKLVVSSHKVDFEKQMKDLLFQGYQPHGSPFILDGVDRVYLNQAMVKYE